MKVYSKAVPAAASPLANRINQILDSYNESNADEYETCSLGHHEPYTEPMLGINDVVKAMSALILTARNVIDDKFIIDQALVEIMMDIAGDEYKPWPELTREELHLFVDDRKDSSDCPSLYRNLDLHETADLSFLERVWADSHREWLEKGAGAKCRRLAKAQAEIAKLTGKAA